RRGGSTIVRDGTVSEPLREPDFPEEVGADFPEHACAASETVTALSLESLMYNHELMRMYVSPRRDSVQVAPDRPVLSSHLEEVFARRQELVAERPPGLPALNVKYAKIYDRRCA